MKLLITGGAGFIGSHVVREAISRGHEVVNFDILNYASDLSFLDTVSGETGYKFIQGDICDRANLTGMFEAEEFDAVLHLAAETHVDLSIKNPSIFVQTNVLGTQNLLDLSLKYNISKFIHISTDEVYGHLDLEAPGFTEATALAPRSPYSASKAGSDMLVQSYHETFGLHTCITRCSNNYGPHQDATKLLPKTMLNALTGKNIPVYGKGQNIRDWLYVEDHVAAIFKVFEEGGAGETYNVGGNNEQTNIELVKKVLQLLGKSDELIEFVEDRPGHDFRYAVDASKIKKELNWSPRKDFDQMLQGTIDWYKQKYSL